VARAAESPCEAGSCRRGQCLLRGQLRPAGRALPRWLLPPKRRHRDRGLPPGAPWHAQTDAACGMRRPGRAADSGGSVTVTVTVAGGYAALAWETGPFQASHGNRSPRQRSLRSPMEADSACSG
jgi:hypothetical protein